jgi:DNA repair exonuclease SbcCD ATPase subunit
MIIEKIRYRNFLSTGNQFNEVKFTETKTTLIVGKNGEGKSTIISALIFGLYGRTNRGSLKKSLINTRNKKDCLVEVDFSKENRRYKVIRGIAPNIFQIYVDDVLQDELSNARDQQKFLEQNIIKCTYSSFLQSVVPGINSFIPFMLLSSSERRNLVEELLDIRVFSTMNNILKEKIKENEKQLQSYLEQKKVFENKIEMQTKFLKTLIESDNQAVYDLNQEKDKYILEMSTLEENRLELESKVELSQKELLNFDFESKLNKLSKFLGKFSQRKTNILDSMNFLNSNSVCPTCSQDIDDEFKQNKLNESSNLISEIDSSIVEIEDEIAKETQNKKLWTEKTNEITAFQNKIRIIDSEIKMLRKNILNVERNIQDIENNPKKQEENKKELRKYKLELKKCEKEFKMSNQLLEYLKFSHLLIKDGGVKTQIVEKYLPVINEKINEYLNLMDLYLNFSLNSEFKETMNTPSYQEFSYDSFSEGEKQKLNLAILFAWRDVAKMKNSINCNVLFLDEVFDSSLDSEGVDMLSNIIKFMIKDSNVLVISHKVDDLIDKFERVLQATKVNGYTQLQYLT